MIVSDKQRVVYIAPPKTGSVSVLRTLLDSEVFCGYNPHRSPRNHHRTEFLPGKKDYFHFMTVRHPYLRAYSFWRFMWKQATTKNRDKRFFEGLFPPHLGYVSLTQWLHEGPTNKRKMSLFFRKLKTVWMCDWHKQKLQNASVDVHVVHLETLEKDLQVVPGFNEISAIPRLNRQAPADLPWYENFTPKDVSRIQELWPDDFSPFGYEKDFEKVKEGQIFVQE